MARDPFLMGLAVVSGLAIGFVDSRPGWDDTGITAFALCLFSALFAALEPKRPWLWGLAVAGWIPILSLANGGHLAMLLVLAIGLAGAYLGCFASPILCAVAEHTPSAP